MLKEKKKLNTKIDNLMRKVQSLQSKLAAATANKPPLVPELVTSFPTGPSTITSPPVSALYQPTTVTASSHPTQDRVPPVARKSSTRAVSGPLPTQKTPERRLFTPSMHESRTASRNLTKATTSDPAPPPPSSSTGKKRKIPDDYDESIPPQGFTADCLPIEDAVKTTPPRRLRGASGFTPVRSRPSIGRPAIPSPTLGIMPISIADVTNNPRQRDPSTNPPAKPKRTWLGKIKGVSSQAAGLAASSHTFERFPGAIS
jgi:hypothetical protein